MVRRAKALADAEKRSRSGLQLQIRDRGSMPHEPLVGDFDRPLSQARLASYNCSELLTPLTLSGTQRFLHRAQIGETHLRILAG